MIEVCFYKHSFSNVEKHKIFELLDLNMRRPFIHVEFVHEFNCRVGVCKTPVHINEESLILTSFFAGPFNMAIELSLVVLHTNKDPSKACIEGTFSKENMSISITFFNFFV